MRWLICFFALVWMTAPAQAADWLRLESEHFIGYSDGSEQRLRDDISALERYDSLLRSQMGVPDIKGQLKLTVFFVRSVDIVQKSLGNYNVAGYYTPTTEGAVAIVPRQIGDGRNELAMTGKVVLFHEYAHHLMYQYFNAGYPLWYSEGFAEFYAPTDFTADGLARIGLPANYRVYGIALGSLIPVRKQLAMKQEELKGGIQGDVFYGQSWALFHMLSLEKDRAGQLTKYVNAVVQGTASLDAATQAFGDLTKLDKELSSYLSRPKLTAITIPNAAPTAMPMTLTRLSPGVSESIMIHFAMMRGTPPKNAEPQVQAMRKIAAKYPGDALVQRYLAEAEHDANHYPESIAAAEAALKIDPTLSAAMLWKGDSMLLQLEANKEKDPAKWKAARSWVIKANRANPENATSLLLYYLSFKKEGVSAPDVAIAGMQKAVSLVPQHMDVRVTYALGLAGQKKWDEALVMVKPLTNSAHGGASSYVKELVSRLQAAKTSGSFTEPPPENDSKEKK